MARCDVIAHQNFRTPAMFRYHIALFIRPSHHGPYGRVRRTTWTEGSGLVFRVNRFPSGSTNYSDDKWSWNRDENGKQYCECHWRAVNLKFDPKSLKFNTLRTFTLSCRMCVEFPFHLSILSQRSIMINLSVDVKFRLLRQSHERIWKKRDFLRMWCRMQICVVVDLVPDHRRFSFRERAV